MQEGDVRCSGGQAVYTTFEEAAMSVRQEFSHAAGYWHGRGWRCKAKKLEYPEESDRDWAAVLKCPCHKEIGFCKDYLDAKGDFFWGSCNAGGRRGDTWDMDKEPFVIYTINN